MLLTRARLLPLLISGAVVLAACGGSVPEMTAELAAELGRSDARVTALAENVESAATPREIERGDAIALGYLERHRLGLGSPWRLIDYALADDRLADSARRQVAWAILARTIADEDNERYLEALDYLVPGAADARAGRGRKHADLIESEVGRASDPRIGEITLRIAYSIAAAERSVAGNGLVVSTHAAALARDRALARRDARVLIRAAEAAGVDPIWLVGSWRSDRRFLAERPMLEASVAEAELAAIREVPRVLEAIRRIAADTNTVLAADSSGDSAATVVSRDAPATLDSGSLLGRVAAARLAELAAKHGAPPQAPVLLAIRAYRSRLLSASTDDDRTARRAQFVERVSNEESLAAEYALLTADGAAGPVAELAVLAAAVPLRPAAPAAGRSTAR